MTKIEPFFKFVFKKMLFGRVSHELKCFSDHGFDTADITPLGAPSLKISSHLDVICSSYGVKSAKKWLKIDYN